MFKFEELEVVHLEITNNCQASCPMCPRNINGGPENPLLKMNDWTLDDFKSIFTLEVLNQISRISFCGNFGEPILNNDLIKMCEYASTVKPSITILIHTNGSARSTTWWKNLYKVLPTNHRVIFALDGLEDTHKLYRIGTYFDQIIKNATTFINAGGTADWDFIRFRHNQHQVEQCEALAKEIGFVNFKVKDSKRFGRSFPVIDTDGVITHYIDQPTNNTIKFVSKDMVKTYKDWPRATEISCFAQKGREIFIDAQYQITPCCMVASFLYMNFDVDLHRQYNLYLDDMVLAPAHEIQNELWDFVREVGNISALDNGIKTLLDNTKWQTIWEEKWASKGSGPCITMCSAGSPYIQIIEQTVKNTQVNE